jgi:ribosomal protein S13
MADLNSLGIPALTDMSQDEAIEHLRQIRLSRRIPVKQQSTSTTKKKQKAKAIPKVSATQAANLLKLLGD